MKTFINMLRDDSGASAAEYALILAIIGAAIAIAAITLGGAVATAMNRASNCVKSICRMVTPRSFIRCATTVMRSSFRVRSVLSAEK